MNELLGAILSKIKKNQFFFLLILALILIFFQIRLIGPEQFVLLWSSLNIYFIVLLIITYTIQFFFRAWLWIRISKLMNINIDFAGAYFALGVGWMVNEILPAKLGDLSRIEITRRNQEISFGESSAPVVFQRLVDLSMILFLGGFSLLYYIFTIGSFDFVFDSYIFYGFLFGILFIAVAIVVLTFLIKYPSTIKRLLSKISPKLELFASGIIDPFVSALKSLKTPLGSFVKSFLFSLTYWIFDVLTFYYAFLAAGVPISPSLAIFAGIITYLVKMFPLTPGGWGIAESLSAYIVYTFNPSIPFDLILFVLMMCHIFVFLYSNIFGFFGLWFFFAKKERLVK